jgi:hypothetical protein
MPLLLSLLARFVNLVLLDWLYFGLVLELIFLFEMNIEIFSITLFCFGEV